MSFTFYRMLLLPPPTVFLVWLDSTSLLVPLPREFNDSRGKGRPPSLASLSLSDQNPIFANFLPHLEPPFVLTSTLNSSHSRIKLFAAQTRSFRHPHTPSLSAGISINIDFATSPLGSSDGAEKRKPIRMRSLVAPPARRRRSFVLPIKTMSDSKLSDDACDRRESRKEGRGQGEQGEGEHSLERPSVRPSVRSPAGEEALACRHRARARHSRRRLQQRWLPLFGWVIGPSLSLSLSLFLSLASRSLFFFSWQKWWSSSSLGTDTTEVDVVVSLVWALEAEQIFLHVLPSSLHARLGSRMTACSFLVYTLLFLFIP
jgi:hypothetical protein